MYIVLKDPRLHQSWEAGHVLLNLFPTILCWLPSCYVCHYCTILLCHTWDNLLVSFSFGNFMYGKISKDVSKNKK